MYTGFVKTGLWATAIGLAILIILSVLYLAHGSLETFPTEDQNAKAEITAIASLLIFAALETVVATILFRRVNY